jgi:predicted outer membrane repeat protein
MLKLARWLVPATLVAVLVAAGSARAAATYTVNTTADNPAAAGECSGAAGDCSLRQALDKAVSGDTVAVPASASPYVVTSIVTVPGGVTIQGAGASSTTISGGGVNQILDIHPKAPDPGAPGTTLKSLTLTDGTNSNPSDDESGTINEGAGRVDLTLDGVAVRNGHSEGGWGGGMEVGGNVTITNSRFTNNSAAGHGGGGAIDFFSGSTVNISNTVFENNTHADAAGGAVVMESNGTLILNSSTFSGNSVTSGAAGGALELESGNTATIQNSTFSGNSAPTSGGAIHVPSGSLTLVNDTFSGNSAPAGASVDDGASTTTAQNTIFAAPAGGGDSCGAVLTTSGHDLDDSATNSCGLSPGSGDLIGQNPALGALADNSSTVPTAGGPPQTMALPATSPAAGAADAAGCTTVGNVDERGFPRPGVAGGGCDIGAFETLPQVGTSTAASTSNAHPAFHHAVTISAAIASAQALPAAVPGPSGTVTFRNGTTALGSAPVAAGHASISVSGLSAGAHEITATYSGDSVYGGSASTPVAVTVAPPRPSISRLHESHKVWRLGSKRARISRAHRRPVGTTFRFKLNTKSTVRLTFRRIVGHKRRSAGGLTFKNVRAGQRKLAFQGRLEGHRKLKRGRYTMTLTASNSTGHTSHSIKFRIV